LEEKSLASRSFQGGKNTARGGATTKKKKDVERLSSSHPERKGGDQTPLLNRLTEEERGALKLRRKHLYFQATGGIITLNVDFLLDCGAGEESVHH